MNITSRSFSRLAALGIVLVAGCTETTPWAGQGEEGNRCYPDQTCDPGLTCVSGICRRSIPGQDQGTWPGAEGGKSEKDTAAPDGSSWPPAEAGPDLPQGSEVHCPNPPAPPVLTSYPTTSAHTTIVVTGTASGASTVAASGGTSPAKAAVSGGKFCLQVSIGTSSSAQTISVVAIDGQGCTSKPTVFSVTYSTKPINLLSMLVGTPSKQPSSGQVSSLTDGNVSNLVRFSFSDSTTACDNNIYVSFDMKALQTVSQLQVKYPNKSSFDLYLRCWALVASQKASPSFPITSGNPDWTVVKYESDSSSSTSLVVDLTPFQARHLAVVMYENNEWNIASETFEITEVEAWGIPAVPSCP